MSASSRSVVWEKSLALAALLLVSLIAARPLWGPGLLNTRGGGDSPFLLLRTHQLAVNLRAGVFPARWMPDAAYGFGYPFFSYYAALPYYVAAGLTVIGLNILTAIKLTQTLFLAAAALAMYHWVERVLWSRAGAWLAAVAYTAAPFHLVNVYVRGDSLSEFGAFAFYPLILWGLDRLTRQPTLRRTLLPALAYAGLIVTHNVSALIFSPFVLLYVVLHVWRFVARGSERQFAKSLSYSSLLILPLVVALLLSAWFWLPALREAEYVQLDVQTTGYFFYGNHFRGSDLVQRTPVFDYATGRDDGRDRSPFAMGLVQAALASAGVLVVGANIIRRVRRFSSGRQAQRPPGLNTCSPQPARETLVFAALGLLLSTWLITPLSRPLWDHLPLLPMIQFPWRFLSVQALFAAVLTGAIIHPFATHLNFTTSWIVAAVLGTLLIATALVGLRPAYLPIRADEVTVDRLQLYELFTGNIGSTVRHEYLPRWVKPRPYTGLALFAPDATARALVVSGEVSDTRRLERQPTVRVWEVEAGEGRSVVAFPLHYWPGWHASVDGVPVEAEPAPGSGYLSISVPPGAHTVEIRLGRTPLRLWSEVVSLVTGLAALAVAILGERRGAERRKREPHREANTENGNAGSSLRNAQSTVSYLVSYLPFAIVLVLLLASHPRVTAAGIRDLTMDFEEMPYLHHNPDGVTFDGWRISGYDYDRERVSPGETLQITLDWKVEAGSGPHATKEGTTVRLVSPATIRDETVPPVAETSVLFGEQAGIEGEATAKLSVPPDAAPGLYLPQLISESTITLRSVWIDPGDPVDGEPVLAAFAGEAARLHRVQATQSAPDRLDVQLDWSAAEPMGANYGLSLSLTDSSDREWLHQGERPGYDTQPGHGFVPTSLWPIDRVIHDRHTAALEPGAPPSDGYVLTVDLYRVATWESVGRYTRTVSLTEVHKRPDAPILARLGEELALSRLEIPRSARQGDEVQVTAYWVAAEKPSKDYSVEWRLEALQSSITSTQPLAPGSSPVDWPVGAWIAGRTTLDVPTTAPAGAYTVSLILRDPESGAVLGSYTHAEPIEVQERRRIWELPPMDQRVGARFGGMIELAGYDLRQKQETIHLTLHWRALTTPDQHYMFFVHLADPGSGQPVRQVDEMPRGFTYPTGLWAPGEVVSDEMELPVEDAPAGHYDLAVGWYDPDTRARLEAVDAEGRPLPDDRLLLPDGVSLP
jgi:hypothetical protein